MSTWVRKLLWLAGRRRKESELREELEFHLAEEADERRAVGLTAEQARLAARRDLGNVALVIEDTRASWGGIALEQVAQDLRYAMRQVRRAPLFACVVAATLALGIGGTTAVFSVVRAVLLAPLPYEEPGQLVRFYQQEPEKPSTRNYVSATHFRVVREHAASFESVAALDNYSEAGLDLVTGGQAQRLRVLRVTSDYFRTLRVASLRGPGLELADETGTRRVVLSDSLWAARFNRDPAVVGQVVQLSAEAYEIVGVAPEGFEDPIVGHVDAWLPYNLVRDTSEENYGLTAIGRLRNGVSIEQARSELAALSQSMRARWPAARLSSFVTDPLREDLVATARGPLNMLVIAVGLVLLVACVNVANLMLVRATSRVQEFAVRSALGSGGARLVRQLLVESLAFAALGGLLGLALAWLGVRILRTLGRGAIPRLEDVGFDPAVLGFTALVATTAAIAFGLAPAFRLLRISPNQMCQPSRSNATTRAQERLRSGLAAAQLSLALALLVAAGVLMASFARLQDVNLGFRISRVLTFEVNLPAARYDAAKRAAFHEALADRLRAIAGVTHAGGVSRLPATGSYHPWGTRIESGPLAGTSVSRALGVNIQQRTVSGGLFAALGIPVLAGRVFDERDDASIPARAVVSANFARQAFPGLSFDAVVGQRIAPLGQRREIIGVVGDVALDVYGSPTLVVYHAHRQFAGNRNWALTQIVAAELPPERILPAVRAAVAALDPELVVHRAAPMTDVVGRGISRERFTLVLMGTFAGVALLLAAIGLYGVLAYAVRQRTPELGVRLALGATAAQVLFIVLRQAAAVVGTGLVVGVVASLMLGRWLSALVFETSPWDLQILVATALLLTLTSFVSALLPAWRASRVEPRVALQDGF
jgi:putative ABC transport system permease protein